ncbi:hypothetical protein [Vibrio neptunius]|uniref:hypothetical protein n=1 Tax=Vibrio neptunius TaxID=170651 RepID=UPI001C5CA69A|nr:hypothetical protein [Vibrio neptunius]QXX05425.1 hypothetical protein KW548_09145 [Vibrio neptunius]
MLIAACSIRASDFPADKGVLPLEKEQSHICVVTIPDSRHNDMTDDGPEWLKEKMNFLVRHYLQQQSCSTLKAV